MNAYHPDRWCLIKIVTDEEELVKVFGTWGGGFTTGSSWKLSSGVTETVFHEEPGANEINEIEIRNHRGSVYFVFDRKYGSTGYGFAVIDNLMNTLDNQTTGVSVKSISVMLKEEALDYLRKVQIKTEQEEA